MSEKAEASETPRNQPTRLSDYKAPAYLIDTVDLDVQLAARATKVRSRLKMRPNPDAVGGAQALALDGIGLTLIDVRLGGKKLTAKDYTVSDTHLTILAPPSKPFTLDITTSCDPESNKALSGLYRSNNAYCTQCEAEGFRRITYFLDRPDVLATYCVRIEADRAEAPVLLANGNLVESGALDNGRHFAVWKDPFRKPCYLFALVGGWFVHVADTFTTKSGRQVALKIYVEPGKEDRCAWAMDSLKRSMRWDEERFGREYDLDIYMIVAVSDFNMGAMENKGLNIFNDKLVLASPETATDANYEAIEAVIAHEYFHNWTGNRITCRDWFQLCLKEGLTVFRDQEFSADERSRTVQRISDVRALRAAQFAEDAGPLAHPVRPDSYLEINNFYTATVYDKGAEICRMLHTMLGEAGFRKGMDLYFARHDGEATTVEKFITCFEDANGTDLSQMMLWYSQSGTPELVARLDYDKKSKTATLSLEQVLAPTPGQSKKKPFPIPVRLGLIGDNGHDLPLLLEDGTPVENGLIVLRKSKQVFRFRDVPSRPVPSLLRGFSAPVTLSMPTDRRDLEFLMIHDSDLFNRWQAAQSYATRELLDLVATIRAGKKPRVKPDLADALASTMTNEALEPAYRAQFLALPSEADLARELKKDVDPEAIHQARQLMRRAIGEWLEAPLTALYDQHAIRGAYRPDANSVGKRALRHATLSLLAATGSKTAIERVAQHYAKARNMTEQMAALTLLSDIEGPERTTAFADFEARWSNDALVMDKWFALEATSNLPGTLARIEALMQHRLFSMQNPNKVRALISAFAYGNQLQFHRPDGLGYRFVGDRVLSLDSFNPQIAARLLGSFGSWRSMESGRRKHAKKVLKSIAVRPNLSRDVTDIVTRMLAK